MSRAGLTSPNISQVEGHYQKWQEVKHRQRKEEHRILQQKLGLQHKLIAAVDARSHRRQQELLQKQTKEREARRQEKKQRDEELVKKGKESITRGLKSQAAPPKKTSDTLKSSDDTLSTNEVRPPPHRGGRRLSAIPSREAEEMPRTASVMSSAGGDAVQSSGRDRRPVEERIRGWDQLPPHKQELYRLFGPQEAECFLHPKIMPEKKRVIQVPNALRKQGGRAGADPLWHLLRSKTHLKLEQADSQIPVELKKAYSAYIREYLTHTKPASRTHFYTERDLPPSERVEDGRYHEHVREIRHRTELMYRSSLANEDRTAILMHDNPMPDFNDLNGGDGIHRYHPSWVDQEEDVPDSGSDHEQGYQKWLPPLESVEVQDEPEPERPRSSPASQRLNTKGKARTGERRHRSQRGQKLSFLTEEAAMSEGQFWRNRRNPDIPEPSIPGHMIMGEVVAEDDDVDYINQLHERNLQDDIQEADFDRPLQPRSRTADSLIPRDATTPIGASQQQAKWQPLTFSALGDHRPMVDLLGSRDFRFGQPTTWKPIVADNSPST